MTTIFNYPIIQISSSSDVFKSEDGEIYNFLYSGGNYTDGNLCIPSFLEEPNYYFYSGDGEIKVVAVQQPNPNF